MHTSTKGRYAVNAMIDLAQRETMAPVSLASIGQRQQTSLSYLEQLFGRMRRSGLVESTRGPGGGYRLARPASAISVADIVNAVDDPAGEDEDGAPVDLGPSRRVWMQLREVMLQHLATVSLQQLLDEQPLQAALATDRPAPAQAHTPAARPGALAVRRPLPPNSVFAFGRAVAAGLAKGYSMA